MGAHLSTPKSNVRTLRAHLFAARWELNATQELRSRVIVRPLRGVGATPFARIAMRDVEQQGRAVENARYDLGFRCTGSGFYLDWL